MKMEERDRLIREAGRAQGEERISKLNLCLLEAKRYEDLERASKDGKYRELLLKEFGI